MTMFVLSLAVIGHLAGATGNAVQAPAIVSSAEGDVDFDGALDTVHVTEDYRLVIDATTAGRIEYQRPLGSFEPPASRTGVAVNEAGAVVLWVADAIGSHRYAEEQTFGYRDGEFVMTGVEVRWAQSTSILDRGSCRVDLLAGRGERSSGWTDRNDTEFATPASAPSMSELAAAQLVPFPPECRIWEIDRLQIEADLDGDGQDDLARFSPDGAGPNLRITSSRGGDVLMIGEALQRYAAISALPSGSFQLSEPVDGMPSVMTIAYRRDAFRLAGFTMDLGGEEKGGTRRCDLNFLAGRGELDGEPFASDVPAMPLSEFGPEVDGFSQALIDDLVTRCRAAANEG